MHLTVVPQFDLSVAGRKLPLGREPVLMGVLNVTPDSFSDGGQFVDVDDAVAHAEDMLDEGAGIIDVGGESTRPGAPAVSADEQIRRVVPVIERVVDKFEAVVSIDTTLSEVAEAALDAGAAIINDISALRDDANMAALAAERGCPVVLMHMQGTPETMQQNPSYNDVVTEVIDFLREQCDKAVAAGIEREQLIVDPGIGFGKKMAHNLQLMRQLERLHELELPVLVGPSRKSFIGNVLKLLDPSIRLWGTAATVSRCMQAGVQIVRVHDVCEMGQVARMTAAMCEGWENM